MWTHYSEEQETFALLSRLEGYNPKMKRIIVKVLEGRTLIMGGLKPIPAGIGFFGREAGTGQVISLSHEGICC